MFKHSQKQTAAADSLWTAVTHSCIVLSEAELKDFLRKYNDIHMSHVTLKKVRSMTDTDKLFSADGNAELDFRIICCDPQNSDGKVFTAYTDADGRLNTSPQKRFEEYAVRRWNGGSDYLIPSRFPLQGAYIFDRPYDSYETFKTEFISKLSNYLPDDFDWDGRLGDFTSIHYIPAGF